MTQWRTVLVTSLLRLSKKKKKKNQHHACILVHPHAEVRIEKISIVSNKPYRLQAGHIVQQLARNFVTGHGHVNAFRGLSRRD